MDPGGNYTMQTICSLLLLSHLRHRSYCLSLFQLAENKSDWLYLMSLPCDAAAWNAGGGQEVNIIIFLYSRRSLTSSYYAKVLQCLLLLQSIPVRNQQRFAQDCCSQKGKLQEAAQKMYSIPLLESETSVTEQQVWWAHVPVDLSLFKICISPLF